MDAVGRTEFFPMTVVTLAHILYPAAAIPAADHWYEGITAVTAGKKSCIAVSRPVAIGGSGVLLQKRLYLTPFLFGDDCRIEVLMPDPTIVGYAFGFSTVGFCSVIDQHPGIPFLHQHIFYTDI